MSKSYEIEIKSLLGSKNNADSLRQKIVAKSGKLFNQDKQLNHYFIYTDLKKFHDSLLPHIPAKHKINFSRFIQEGKNLSIRTRQANEKVTLIIKASLDDHSSSNGVSREELDIEVKII